MTSAHGNNAFFYLFLILFLFYQLGFMCKQKEIQYEIRKNQKEYSLILEELEEKNNIALNGE